MLNRLRQTGFSLVELMVGITVSMIVVAGAAAMYVTTVRGQADALRLARLNQDLRAAMDVMVADVRRAGYWAGSVTVDPGPPVELSYSTSNPYSLGGGTPTALTVLEGGSCVMYAYDADNDGSSPVAAGEVFGFRRTENVLQMLDPANTLTDASDCTAGTWPAMTSNDTVVIDSLTFSTSGSQCLNATQDISWKITAATSTDTPCAASGGDITMNDGKTYAAPVAGDMMTEVRQVTITLVGHHQSDASVAASVTETVHLPNNRIFSW